ncbi:hypothetical protein B0H12DRAFT_1123973 [Mycena haematopus]|nr:hypothetical protein B0H12DRAFT_1123973 [Mycena haematopus]
MKIAANLNQPITSVIGRQIPSVDKTVAAFTIRWFVPTFHEIALCGHGTMVAARAIFEKGLVADCVEVIEFHTQTGEVMRARKAGKDGIEIRLPSATLTEVSSQDSPKIAAAVSKAFGRNVAIKYMGVGSKGFENYVMIELDEKENIGQSKINAVALVSLDTGYTVNVITTASSSGEELFVSRMFAPEVIPPPYYEDQVCGSAHCLTGPYWHRKNGLASDQSFSAKMVSSRGGDLNLFWDQAAAVLALTGETCVMASGEIYV